MSAAESDLSQQAANLFSQGRFSDAERLLEQVVEDDAGDVQAILMLGLCKRALGQHDSALRQLERAAEIGDSSAAAHFHHGRLLAELGRRDEAREALAQAIALDPNHVEARTVMGLLSLQQSDPTRAISELRVALRARDDHVPALAALARALVYAGEIDEAHELATRAVKLDPEQPAAQDAMARVFLVQGHYDFAEQCLRNALKTAPSSGELHGGLAMVLQHKNKHREALAHFRDAIRRDYGGQPMVLGAADSLVRLGEAQQALRLVEQALERWPGDAALVARAADLRLDAGDASGAGDLLATAEQRGPELELISARVAHASGQPDIAYERLTALMQHPEFRVAREARLVAGRLKARDLDLEGARAALEPLMQTATPDPDAVLTWVEACRATGQPVQGCEPLERLLASPETQDRDRARLHQLLGTLYEAGDQPEQATPHLAASAWVAAPHVDKLTPQHASGLIEAWLEHDWRAEEFEAPDDGLPTLALVAGWPGTGRDLVASALASFPAIARLSADESAGSGGNDKASKRRATLNLPMTPAQAESLTETDLRDGRRSFLHDVEQGAERRWVMDFDWWESTAIPVLARYFPELVVIKLEADVRDLELHWRLAGYAAIDELRAAYHQEEALWERVDNHLPVTIVRVARGDLTERPEQVVATIASALALEPDPALLEALQQATARRPLPAEGRWRAYRSLIDSGRSAAEPSE